MHKKTFYQILKVLSNISHLITQKERKKEQNLKIEEFALSCLKHFTNYLMKMYQLAIDHLTIRLMDLNFFFAFYRFPNKES